MIDLQQLRQACEEFLQAIDDNFENDISYLGPSIEKIKEAVGTEVVIVGPEELRRIWKVPGIYPRYHDAQKARLKNDWPLLYDWLSKQYGE